MPQATVVSNTGKLRQFLTGIQGVVAGGQALINMPVNRRYHRILIQTSKGNPQLPCAVSDVISGLKLVINGVSLRDISPADIIRIAIANGYYPALGELPIVFSEPFLGGSGGQGNLEPPDQLSWDLVGQSSFEIQPSIVSGVTNPGIAGLVEYDFFRNQLPPATPGGEPRYFLSPVTQHAYSVALSQGMTPVTTIPFSYPIRRIWLRGSSADQITQVEIIQDGNKVFEATISQLQQIYRQNLFNFGIVPDYLATGYADGNSDIIAAIEEPSFFDAAVIFDEDARFWDALNVAANWELRITSAVAQVLTAIVEYMPGAYR
jgi:hypothetical protein